MTSESKVFLGIEDSCDDTAVAIVSNDKKILSESKVSHLKVNEPYGGVVPEITARAHLNHLSQLVREALKKAKLELHTLDGFAATAGPGLIGGLICGMQFAKALSYFHNKPFFGVNHLEAHALTPRLTSDLKFPYILLLISGGHTQLVKVNGVRKYQIIGSTLDDALGEAFDKVGKMLGLPYPAGPMIEKLAQNGSTSFNFVRPLCKQKTTDFSFSGLKSDVRRKIEGLNQINQKIREDIACSFQETIKEVLIKKCSIAIRDNPEIKNFVVSGGVASNKYIRQSLQNMCDTNNVNFIAPPIELCTDNGVMIAWAGIENDKAGFVDNYNLSPRPRWPLNEI
ncbi:MAG: tRNA (adenosine(37)-N6)-threonylcarbamoyltransferase complex transferase subunit TsaD [Rickettsiales bacterium]|nr:tRNA (adenosine(37)-N6)-threonylcarbamoyltransferase complex transferase subunit TsaD [Rickettsiales bacterium]|tara:strand:- start:51083 stop:52102 length:1020 start_codon:yes stop_codon:yes gene_type:complete